MPHQSKRRWFQFSTRGVLLLMTSVAIGLGLWVSEFHRRNRALIALRSVSPERGYYRPMRFERAPQPSWPARQKWLTRWLDKDFFNDLVEIDLSGALRPHGDTTFLPLTEFRSLKRLSLNDTQAGDKGMPYLRMLPTLEYLDIRDTQAGDDALVNLAPLLNLEELNLSGTRVTDAGLAHLTGLTRLKSLRLSKTRIGDEGLSRLSGLTALEALDLSETKVTGKTLQYLQTLPWLSYLNLCGTQIDDGDIDALNEMCSLVSVSLLDTGVTAAGLTRLKVAGSISTEPVDARTMAALGDITELDFGDAPLTDVVDYLKQRHDQEIQIDPRLLNTTGFDAFRSSVTYARRDISLLRALEEMLAPFNLVLVYRHSVPLITARPVKPALDVPQLTAGEKLSPRLQLELAQKTYLDFAYEPLPDVVQVLAQRHSIKIIIDKDAFGAEKAYVVPISRAIKGISLRAALGLLLEPLDMVCVAEGDTLVIRPASAK